MRRSIWFWFWSTSIFGEQIQSISYRILWYILPEHWAFFHFFFFFSLKYFDKRSLHRFRSSRFMCMTDTVDCFYLRGSLFLDISKIFLVLHVLVLHVLVLLVLSKFEIILFNSCPHRQWWFRKYAMFFKVIRVLQLSVYLWFYIKFNLNIFFLLKKKLCSWYSL